VYGSKRLAPLGSSKPPQTVNQNIRTNVKGAAGGQQQGVQQQVLQQQGVQQQGAQQQGVQ
jgi:hypothetical protein